MYNHKIVNADTGEEILEPLSNEEIKIIESNIKKAESESKMAQEQAQSNAIAKQVILDRLGLTAEEAALLLK